MPRKIGVLTFHKCINYGSYWQARCLVEGLRARGHEAELLDHHCNCVARAEARCAFQPMLPRRTLRKDMRAYSVKARKFIRAIQHLPLSRTFSLHRPEAVNGYETIVVGSDEVWNLAHPWYGGKPLFYGVGLESPRLISYSGSFGSYSCHWGLHEYWAEQLKRFDALSVRDKNSFWLVRGSTGIEPELVLDPCLQFPQSVRSESGASDDRYVVVYGHSFPTWIGQHVRRWSERRGLRLVSPGYRNDWADEQRIGASPEEFASLIANARAVVTNFFHGCVFALLNGKPFVTATSEYRLHKIRDLAASLAAEHRMVNESTDPAVYAHLLETPVEPRVVERIEGQRSRSKAYLDAALS
jgi:polysaccharide pyruvyl transferase WcaK-like protein